MLGHRQASLGRQPQKRLKEIRVQVQGREGLPGHVIRFPYNLHLLIFITLYNSNIVINQEKCDKAEWENRKIFRGGGRRGYWGLY